jgi:hypothetical protein
VASIDGTLPETGLHKGTNWWGAFVIGLAGTDPGDRHRAVRGPGHRRIGHHPHRRDDDRRLLPVPVPGRARHDVAGPHRRHPRVRYRVVPAAGRQTASRHIGGVSGWAYWLGWFPVAPINVILTASYLAVLFNFSPGHTIDPVGTTWGAPIGITIVLVCFALLAVIFIPAWFGIRLGAAFATVLGILSMLPLTAMIFLPFFKPGSIHWGNVAGFHARRTWRSP